MSNVTLEIQNRHYTIACAEGEESHIGMLGRSINEKLSRMDGLAGQSAERTLLYAALLLADELHEANNKSPAPESNDKSAETLEILAQRLEGIASGLESGLTTS